jgi:hypothetical protein
MLIVWLANFAMERLPAVVLRIWDMSYREAGFANYRPQEPYTQIPVEGSSVVP